MQTVVVNEIIIKRLSYKHEVIIFILGQNKNRYVVGYLLWRVATNRHQERSLHMQIPGHTKCLVDAGFGCFKKVYRSVVLLQGLTPLTYFRSIYIF